MKKILSLILAVLMLASLSVCVMADTSADQVTGLTLGELLRYWSAYNNSGVYGTGLYNTWTEKCPDCGGDALNYFADGYLCWQCINNACRHNGKTAIISTNPVTSGDMYVGKCPECGKSGVCVYAKSFVEDDKVYDQVYCTYCRKYQKILNTTAADEEVPASVTCCHDGCSLPALYTGLFIEDGVLYARYICPSNHTTKKILRGANLNTNNYYIIAVNCPTSGSYKMTGSQFVSYGTEKTIEFTPKSGYVLTDVLVNGVSCGPQTTIKILVKSNVIVVPVFEKASNLLQHTVTLKQNGLGNVVARKNGDVVTPDTVKATGADTVTYLFTPYSANYEIAGVTVDGKNAGRISSYTLSGVTADRVIEVTFRWKNPYEDVLDKYLKAVEYVTETGIIGAYKDDAGKLYFGGTVKVTKEEVAVALAEMADTADTLKTGVDRIAWAKTNGLIADGEDLTAICDVQTICNMVKTFLLAVGKENKVSFKGVNASDTLRQTSIGIGLVSGATFDKNRQLNRYDLAAVCNLITNLTYEG